MMLPHMVGEIAPAAAPVAWGLIAIGGVLSFVFLWTFDKVFRALFAPLLDRVAGIALHAKFVSWAPFGFLHNIVVDVEEWTRSGMAASERAIVYGFGSILWTFYDLTFTLIKMGYDFNTAIDNLWAHVTHGITKVIHETVVKPLTKSVRYVDAKLTARVHTLEHEFDALSAKVAHTAIALPRSLPHADSYFDRLLRQGGSLRARAHRLEQLLTVAGLGALTVAALSRLGFGCFFGKNGRKIGKNLCRVDPDFLESLFLDGALLLGTISLVEFGKETAAVTEFVESKITHFLRELGPAVQDYLGPIEGAPQDVEALLKLSFADYLS